MTEQERYDKARRSKGKKAVYKLANLMAHGYVIEGTKKVTVLTKGDDVIVIDNDGSLIKGTKAI